MPKNERIIEKFVGINEDTKNEIWDRIYDISKLNVDDRMRIYEDKKSKDDNIVSIDGYITKKPKVDDELNITELEFETVNARKARLEQEKLSNITMQSIKEEN